MRKRQDPTAPVTDPDEGFLSRWSRRKRQARSLADDELPAVPAPVEPAVELREEDERPALTDAELPPLETLDENSDYSGFLSPEVSDALRQRALRKLFSSNKFQFRDGLDDYDEDYRSFEPLRGVLTADMRHRLEVESERLARAGVAQPEEAGGEAGPGSETFASSEAEVAPVDDTDAAASDDGDTRHS